MGKELRIPHARLKDSQTITRVIRERLAQAMGEEKALHRYEVDRMEDDHDRKERILTMQPKRTYVGFGKSG